MKSILTSLCTLLVGMSASANFYDSSYGNAYNNGASYERMKEARKRAQKICYGMYSNYSLDCMQVASTNQFSLEAVKACENVGYYNDGKKLECLKTIANNSYQLDLVKICTASGTYNDSMTISCLQKVANKRVQSAAASLCENVGVFSGDAKMSCLEAVMEKVFTKEGLAICETMTYSDTNKIDCAKKIANSYIQPEAANFCKNISVYSDSLKLSCAEKIKNKVFSSEMLNFCSSRYTDQQKIECLAVAQTDSYYIPGFRVDRQRTDLDIILDTLDYIINGTRPSDSVVAVKPAVNKCKVKQTGEVVATEQFYTLAKNTARSERKCVVARMANTDNSSSLIDGEGVVIGSNLSYRKLAAMKRNSKLAGQGCFEYICDDTAR